MQRKIEKNYSVFEILMSELVALKCLYQEGNYCHQQSIG